MMTSDRVRFETDRDLGFADAIRKVPGCESIDRCIQCATCSGICPVATYMDLTPRRVIELTRSGFKNDVLRSNTIWLCASCYACQAECPKQIGIVDVMYALKRRAIQEGAYPKRLPMPVLFREFYRMVFRRGRVTESRLANQMYLRTNPFKALGMLGLGWKLLRTHRLSVKADSMRHPEALQPPLRATHGGTR